MSNMYTPKMTFTTDKLTYKAYTYQTKDDPIHITEQSIQLEKQADGSYNVPANNILIKVHAAALNPVDIVLRQSAGYLLSFVNSYQGIGRDYSGVVEAIGNDVKTTLQLGDKVQGLYTHPFGKGTCSQYVLLDTKSRTDDEVGLIPTNLSLTEAAGWPLVFGTAVIMLDGLDLKDKRVLVLGGATSVGRYVISLSKKAQARDVVATCSGKSASLVTELGANSTIDYTKQTSILNPVLETVKEGKYDIVFDCCGNNDLFGHTSTVLNPHAHYRTIVGDTKYKYATVSMGALIVPMAKSIWRVLSSKLGLIDFNYEFVATAPRNKWIESGKKLIEDGDVKIFTDSVFKFSDIDAALERLLTNQVNGKVIIEVE